MGYPGRPSLYTQEIADKICDRIATSELGLEQVLDEIRATDGWAPSIMTVWLWQRAHPEFLEQSARARIMQAQLLHDRAQQFAQNALIGHVTRTVLQADGTTETTTTVSDNVERSKLLVQTTLKRAGQLDHRRYGDKVQQEVSGGVTVTVNRDEIVRKLLKKVSSDEQKHGKLPEIAG